MIISSWAKRNGAEPRLPGFAAYTPEQVMFYDVLVFDVVMCWYSRLWCSNVHIHMFRRSYALMISRHRSIAIMFTCSKVKCCDVQTLWCSNAELPTRPPKYGRGFLLGPRIGSHVQLTHVRTFHRSNVVMFRCSGSAPATLGVPSTVRLPLKGESGREPTVQGLSGAHFRLSSLPSLNFGFELFALL